MLVQYKQILNKLAPIYLITMLGCLVAILDSLLLALLVISPFIPLILNIALVIAFALSIGLYRTGYTKAATLSVPITLWLYITLGTALLQGYTNPLIQSYIVLIIVCGWLFGTRGTISSFLISMVSVICLIALQIANIVPFVDITFDSAYLWAGVLANMVMLACIVGLLTMRVTDALERSHSRTNKLQELLKALHYVTIELNTTTNMDTLFKNAIVLGREKLGFDRLGLFLMDSESQVFIGTYGVDVYGNLRNEGNLLYPITKDERISEMLNSGESFKLWQSVDLLEDWQSSGIIGWNATALIKDHDDTIGWICIDNLTKQEPVNNSELEIFRLYATTLGHLITRKQAEENLKHSQKQVNTKSNSLQIINRITEVLQQERDIPTLATKTLEQVKQIIPYDIAAIYMLDNDHQNLNLVQSDGLSSDTVAHLLSVPVAGSVTGEAVRNKVATTIHEIENDERAYGNNRDTLLELGIKRMLSVPIIFANNVLGTISLGFRNSGIFDVEDINLMQNIGKSSGMAFTNAQYVSEITIQKELSESIVESIPGIFMTLDSDYRLTQWNNNLLTVLNCSERDIQESDAMFIFAHDKRNEIRSFLNLVEQDGRGTIQTSIMTKNGSLIPYIISASRYELENIHAIILTGIDVSERVALTQRLQLRASQLLTAGDVSKSIVSLLDPNELMDFTVNLVCQRFEYYYVGIFLTDTDNQYAVLRAGSGEAGQQLLAVNHQLEIGGQSMIGHCVKDAEPYIAADVDLVPDHFVNPNLPNTRSEMALPLIHRETCIGAMTVQSSEPDAFSQEDTVIMQFIADHLASALSNARLYDIIVRRQRYLGTLRRVSQQVTPQLEIEAFLQSVVDSLRDEFSYDIVTVMRANYEVRELQGWAISTSKKYANKVDIDAFTQSFEVGTLGAAVSDNQAYIASSTKNDQQYIPYGSDWDIASELAIPISNYDNIIGILSISNSVENSLDELDLEMMQEFANELAIHIENIKLYSATRENAAELEKRVRERTHQLEAVNSELEAFAYSVSHDLRAPLRSVDGFSQALLEDYEAQLDDMGKDFLNRIRAASQRMGNLIDDLLNLSRVTRRELTLNNVDLSQLAQAVVDDLREQTPRDNVQVKIKAFIQAECDERLMRIVLENLLGNAWKFTGNEDLAVIQFGCEHRGEEKIYFVKDNGVGFNIEYKSKLFSPFQRLHTQNEFEGTGIGLATVRRIIRKHGSTIWAESELGEGATFYFTL